MGLELPSDREGNSNRPGSNLYRTWSPQVLWPRPSHLMIERLFLISAVCNDVGSSAMSGKENLDTGARRLRRVNKNKTVFVRDNHHFRPALTDSRRRSLNHSPQTEKSSAAVAASNQGQTFVTSFGAAPLAVGLTAPDPYEAPQRQFTGTKRASRPAFNCARMGSRASSPNPAFHSRGEPGKRPNGLASI